jgi:L-ascorbate metabolism protein UlaG (beta-lactamase superfamily)
MQLFYLGGPTLKIKNETQNGEVTILINPHADVKGLPKIKKTNADVILATVDSPEYFDEKVGGDAFIVNTAGEYEIKDVLISASSISGKEPLLVYRLDISNVSLGYLGGVDAHHDTSMINNALEGVDVLVIPVGGKDILGSGDAMKLVSSLEPRIVIPIQYKTKEFSIQQETVDGFLKEFGAKGTEVQSKIKIERKDLPADERRVVVLG